MKRFEALCPSCGGSVEFKTSAALVTICPHCQSVVGRRDRRVEDLGKVAALAETDSAFYLGQTGRLQGKPFELIGHVQYQHPAGGLWDEWYASFPGQRWLWLAEAQGKTYATQEKDLKNVSVPPFKAVRPGESLDLAKLGTWTVSEVNEATCLAAAGELPFAFAPGAPHRYADLTSADQHFATLDYSDDSPRWYSGREISLAELGISAASTSEGGSPKEISAEAVRCPNCGGALELKAPDQAQRVTCPYCASLLDVDQGNLKYLTTLSSKIRPHIPIGRAGTLNGVEYVVIGFLRRAVRFDKEYTWDEYLLYAPAIGFRWLVHSDYHWSFVEPLAPADLNQRKLRSVGYRGEEFRLFQRAWARVTYVLGEFYWKVSIDEIVLAEDFIAPPRLISVERTPVPGQGPLPSVRGADGWGDTSFSEINVSLSTYLTHEQVEQAFAVKDLPHSWEIAPNQPLPGSPDVYRYWLIYLLVLGLIEILMGGVLGRSLDYGIFFGALLMVSIPPFCLWLTRFSAERQRWADSEFSPYA